MIEARYEIDRNIWWEAISGTSYTWEDNWTGLGAIKSTHPDFIRAPNIKESKFFMDSSGWNREKLHQYLPELVVEHAHKKLQYKYLFELSNHL